METPVTNGVAFMPPANGWYMDDARYQRYRRAVANRIMELSSTNAPAK